MALNFGIRWIRQRKQQRVLRHFRVWTQEVRSWEAHYLNMSDAELENQSQYFQNRVDHGTTLDALLPEAFAAVCEAAERAIGQRPFDVQIMGAMALHRGHIAEMATGEGKTLTAILAAYLNAFENSVHIATANPYLASRDAEWMGKVFKRLGMEVGCILPQQVFPDKKRAYSKKIVYAPYEELGYDYLRDHMVMRDEDRVMPAGKWFMIADEADHLFIDCALKPLLISGKMDSDLSYYSRLFPIIRALDAEKHLSINTKDRMVYWTEEGVDAIEEALRAGGFLRPDSGLYQTENLALLHYLDACLKAQFLYQAQIDYIVHDQQVLIVDEYTGRALLDRRWGGGLHQALEAKEGLRVQPESQTLASIAAQNFFRRYQKLSGMTGTASTEQDELREIYRLEVLPIPTHRPVIRTDGQDRIFLSKKDKLDAICEDIRTRHRLGQPILIGSPSVEDSEELSALLTREGIRHEVLNAKQHAKEAQLIAQAGCLKAVTIATSMAGRGTDIILGGDPKADNKRWEQEHERVKALGGLHVIGMTRLESRRLDLQLRGRAGRQGDPGSSQFYLSLEDSLFQFSPSLIKLTGMQEKMHLQSALLDRAIAHAQFKVEQQHCDIRKNLLKYDDIINDQRLLIYAERDAILEKRNIPELFDSMLKHVLLQWAAQASPQKAHEEWDVRPIEERLSALGIRIDLGQWLIDQPNPDQEKLEAYLHECIQAHLRAGQHGHDASFISGYWASLLLKVLDQQWKNHLAMIDHLRQSIHLRSYAQKNPTHEFTKECFELFYAMLNAIREESVKTILLTRLPQNLSRRSGSYQVIENH